MLDGTFDTFHKLRCVRDQMYVYTYNVMAERGVNGVYCYVIYGAAACIFFWQVCLHDRLSVVTVLGSIAQLLTTGISMN